MIRTDQKAAENWLDAQQWAQPWQMLAAIYERNGQPADARRMRYRSAVRSTRTTRGFSRQTYRWTTGHGYYPLATLCWLIAIIIIAVPLTAGLADEFTTTTTLTIRDDLKVRADDTQPEHPPIPKPPPGRALAT